MKKYLGIDLGGTNVRVAKVDEEGNIIEDIIKPSYGQEGPEKITSNVLEIIEQFDLSDVEGIGVGIPGPVDQVKNVITMASNIPGMEYYPFAQIIEEKTGKKVYLDNDANVAGLAEAILGSGKGKRIVYYITHSTGIGGALIFDGQIVAGRTGYAGEIGNIIVKDGAPKITHLNPGAAEPEASGTGIGRKGSQVFGEKGDSARKVFDLATKGDPKALEILDGVAKDMARMLQSIAQVVDPDCFIIGGGVSKSSDLYWGKMKEYYNELVCPGMKDVPFLKPTIQEPGVVGAALLVGMHEHD